MTLFSIDKLIKLSSRFVNFKNYMINPTRVFMKKNDYLLLAIILLFNSLYTLNAQEDSANITFIPEFVFGTSVASNKTFPERNPQIQTVFNILWHHENNTQEWARRLPTLRTGISAGYTNFGNNESLGSAYSLVPFVEFNVFNSKRLTTQIGVGASYFTNEYDFETNFFNRAISTDFTWSFKAFLHYNFLEKEKVNYRIGGGVFHHSNGHMRLPNQGFNSFLISVSAELKGQKYRTYKENLIDHTSSERTVQNYIDIRAGIGQNVFSDVSIFNDKKEVYTISAEYGKIYNKTFKVGIGAFYRIYEHYYDYIRGNEFLVRDGQEFASLRENPWNNASNYGVFTKGELLLNHVGFELQLGVNFHKPAYKIDWRINEGWDLAPREIPEVWVFGEFNSKFRLKNAINARAGLKYYLIGTDKAPKHNIYAGAFINANLGQADFTELGIGYVYAF